MAPGYSVLSEVRVLRGRSGSAIFDNVATIEDLNHQKLMTKF